MEASNVRNALFFYSTLYTDSPHGSNNVVAHHVNFAQIACSVCYTVLYSSSGQYEIIRINY